MNPANVTVPYTAQKRRFFEEASRREVIQIRIDPQKHEVSITPDSLYRKDSPLPPQQMLETAMLELLRDQAAIAHRTVLRAGLEALHPGATFTDDQMDEALRVAEVDLLRRLTATEADRDQWKALAEKRKGEIETLERVLRPR